MGLWLDAMDPNGRRCNTINSDDRTIKVEVVPDRTADEVDGFYRMQTIDRLFTTRMIPERSVCQGTKFHLAISDLITVLSLVGTNYSSEHSLVVYTMLIPASMMISQGFTGALVFVVQGIP